VNPRFWRAIVDGRHPGALNMAADEALMICQTKGAVPPTLRLYGWSPPCISLGYFQKADAEVDVDACARAGLELVRRPTGGRAVLHDDEVTYSLVIPQVLLPGGVLETYRRISSGLLQALAYLGIRGELARPARRPARRRETAVDGLDGACFDSPSWYETLVGGRKIAGSAQTRQNGVILQHGSLLLSFDPARLASVLRTGTPARRARLEQRLRERVTAVSDEIGRPPGRGEVETALICGMARALGLEIERAGYAREELELTRELYHGKYGTREWTFRR